MVGLSKEDVSRAQRELAGVVRHTPAWRLFELETDCELWAKAENLQYIGAFKARGASLAVSRLTTGELTRGVITYSSGNHAQAVALAASRAGVSATIAMPEDAPNIKVDSVRRLGAAVEFAGTTSEHRKARAHELRRELGATIIEPFNHPHIIAGQGTATAELAEDVEAAAGPLDALVVPVGGGGLIAGACLALEGSDTAVYSAEPVGCDSMRQSLAAGKVVPVEPGPTIADGLKPTRVGELNLAVCQGRVAGSYTVHDDELRGALLSLLFRCGLLVEPSGAAALAVALRGNLPNQPRRVGVILSGRNVAPARIQDILGTSPVG